MTMAGAAAFLPIMSYGDYNSTSALPSSPATKEAAVSLVGAGPTAAAPEAVIADAPSTPTAASYQPQHQATGERRPAVRQPAKRLTPLELRAKAVMGALEKLLEGSVQSEEQLWLVARILSGDEYAQVAEERSLAGLCGNPLCSSPTPPLRPEPRSGRYKIDVAAHMVYEREGCSMFCCGGCEAAVRGFAARLGPHAAAQHRFDVLMRAAKQAATGGASGQQQTATGGAGGQQQSAGGAAATAAAAAAAPLGSEDAAVSKSTGGGKIQWKDPQTQAPMQWMAHSSRPSATTAAAAAAAAATTASAATSPSAAVNGGQPGTACTRPGSGGPKGVLKKKYAAGTPKVPIMLAEIKERDPSMVAVDTARLLPPDAALRPSSASSRSGPRAVEGYVPRAGKSQFKHVQAGPQQQQQEEEERKDGESPGRAAEASPGRRVRFSDEAGGSLEMPSAAELAAAAAAATAATGSDSSDSIGSPQGGQQEASAAARMEQPRQPSTEAAVPKEVAAPSSSTTSAVGSPPVADAGTASKKPPQQRKPPTHPLASARRPGPLLNGWGSGSSGSNSSSSSCCPSVPAAAAPLTPGAAAAPTASVEAPVLVFDIEDPRGPLEAADGAAVAGDGLATQFGLLRVVDSSNGCEDVGGAADATAQQPGVAVGAPVGTQQAQQPNAAGELLTQQMQSSLRRLFPRLSTTLPPDLDARLEAELASDTDDDAESVGWSSSSDEEAAAGVSSDDETAGEAGGRQRSAYRMQLSFFGTLFTHLESWLTDATLEHIASGPGTPAPAAAALPPASAHSAQIEAALARFLAAALPPVVAQLHIGGPRGEVERALVELLRTMRFSGPLPAFKSTQWQLLAIILLKALSLERAPSLREAFETRDGIARLNKALGELKFTYEEFVAVLELLLPVD